MLSDKYTTLLNELKSLRNSGRNDGFSDKIDSWKNEADVIYSELIGELQKSLDEYKRKPRSREQIF